jgi:hypothetical protein
MENEIQPALDTVQGSVRTVLPDGDSSSLTQQGPTRIAAGRPSTSAAPLLIAATVVCASWNLVFNQTRATGGMRKVLWSEPSDIKDRNLFYGPGGEAHQPRGSFTFIKEDLNGSKPKFDVRDENGVRWRIKLGAEARPETVATRLVWAVGYYADEDYFLREAQVRGLPTHLHRGRRYIGAGGTVHDLRMERKPDDRMKVGTWRWGTNPFSGTRELNGLAVLMAVINNWDLKDSNNTIHRPRDEGQTQMDEVYEIGDLGSSFGSAGLQLTDAMSEGNLRAYRRSRFIDKLTPHEVDFHVPAQPALIVLGNPHQYFSRLGLEWIGRSIPRADARWIGHLLGQLSAAQLRDAFRAAQYPTREIDGFTAEIQERIAQLNAL